MRKTSIPGWALGSARPGEAAGNYCAERCRLCQRHPERAKLAVKGWLGSRGGRASCKSHPFPAPWQPGAGAEWAHAGSWLGADGEAA